MLRLLFAWASCLAACSLVTPLDDLRGGGSDASTDGLADSSPQGDAIDDMAIDVPLASCADAGYTVCGNACVDLQNDGNNCGACSHDCLGGACTGGACQVVTLAAGQAYPVDLAIDAAYVYWTIWGSTAGNFNDGEIRRCAITGCGGVPQTVTKSGSEPTSVAVDASYVYFGNHGDGSVAKCPLSGCAVPTPLAPGGSGLDPRGIAVDGTNAYWVSNADNTLYRCAKNGCNNAPTPFYTSLSGPWRVALDATNAYASGDTILQIPLNGDTPVVLATAASARGIDVGTTDVYFAKFFNGSGTVSKCAIGGCSQAPTSLIGSQNDPYDVAVDATGFYWSDNGSGDVMSCPLSGCPVNPTVLASGQNAPTRVRVSAKAIFWANSGTVGNTDGSIMMLAK